MQETSIFNSDLEDVEKAIKDLRKKQLGLKVQKKLKSDKYDPVKAKFVKEWLKDLYYIRNHYPGYKPQLSKSYSSQHSKEEILFDDPALLDLAAKTDFNDPFEFVEQNTSERVIELMDDLSANEWEAVTMVWLHGLGPTEAGKYMNCTAKNVSTYLLRARAKMLKKIETPAKQMVISGFDLPPTIHRKRTVKACEISKKTEVSFEQLAIF
ncbi:hypothetical protein [Desulfitobacterium sp.]|uniref:hypothetical protein n=1 Tax=Desulfitobacterium sp. TaxID=49981 RepID=UPI002C974AC0|nr:hypothetical protein [Desulfitobacterium sp.]HVJ49389.1 hypothetical protein [Desulfitobacterium sp.]